MLFRFFLVSSIGLCLTACNSDEGDDLDIFIKDSIKNMPLKIKPLPEVKPYLALQYNVDGQLPDPFYPRKVLDKSSQLQPNASRSKEPMEAYPLANIKYVGMISKKNLTYALLLSPDNDVQLVKIGNYVGQNSGLITDISDNEVKLKEIIQDDVSGDWIERISTLSLQEQSGK